MDDKKIKKSKKTKAIKIEKKPKEYKPINNIAQVENDSLKKQAQEYLAGWQRVKADFDNYKKDEKKRIENFALFIKVGFVLEVLPALDSFEEALKSIPEKEKESGWVKGILKIKNQIEEMLKKMEVTEIKADGEEFNPMYHEAIGEAIGKEEDRNKVIKVLQKGYKMGEQTIRPARVFVGK
jgi:molecular chaperone GrpE